MINRNMVRENSARAMNCRNLQKRLQAVDFAIAETTLYLDVYPDCKRALEYHKRLLRERNMIADALRGSCGPVTSFEEQTDGWEWVNVPPMGC